MEDGADSQILGLAKEKQNAAKCIIGVTNLRGEPGGGQRGFAEIELSYRGAKCSDMPRWATNLSKMQRNAT